MPKVKFVLEKEILDLIGELAYTCGIMIKELEGKLNYDGSLSWCYKKFTEIWEMSLDMQRKLESQLETEACKGGY